ncbi:DUF4179 domain-containing protein [Paenibacillus thailandensis]|uniref:DUF4179 domain-containing protein n=1 Tax=Paenibacillus thailandensis TaxID=393250 RepID=A0ABW5QV17_9BACL
MDKWEQELKKHVDLALPDSIDERIQLTLSQIKRKHNKSSKLRHGATAAVASLVLIFGLSSLSPVFAEAMKSLPLVESIFELGGDAGMKRGNQLQLTAKIGQQVQIEDQLVTFTESLYDGSNINLGIIVTEKDEDPLAFATGIVYTVDGEVLEYGGNSSLEKLGDGTYAGTISITPDRQLPDSFVLGILSRDQTKTLAEIPVKRQGGSHTYTIAQTRIWNDIEVNYEAVTLFPTTTEINFQLRNTDSAFWELQIYDEQGRVLQPISHHARGSDNQVEVKTYFEPLETIPKQLTIKPYLSSFESDTKWSGKWNGTPITLSQGKAGALTILDRKWENNQLTLTYEVTGERIFEQMNQIWLEDRNGNRYFKETAPIRIHGSSQYQVTFSNVTNIDTIYICTAQVNIHYLEELAVTVDLAK